MSENKRFKRYTVTSALPYANGPLHIGHLAGAYLPADIFVRYLRSRGEDVIYICGSDEHGTAIAMKALDEGTTPQAIVDKYHAMIRDAFRDFSFSFDIYSRTSNPTHHQTAQEFFLKFYNDGKLIRRKSAQLYDEEKQIFLADRFVMGTCPNCGNDKAYGNQCEKCGKDLSPEELINPVSRISGTTPIMKDTEHWFLPLDQYEPWLKEYILQNHTDWKANVYGQCKSWLDGGLTPRAITRDLDWGVEVPVPEGKGKVLYVWFDAPIGYVSATKEWGAANGKDWEPYWKSDDTALYHFIGKDNIVFHCIIFPAILKGQGDFIVPENVPANEFLNIEGEKISTSRNWAVWMHEFLQDFPGQADVMRYVLTAMMPENKDADFTWVDYQTRNNSELVDTFANFVNRIKVLTLKNFGTVPARQSLNERDQQLIDSVLLAQAEVGKLISQFRFKEALSQMMEIARAGDRYLSELEPWKLVKSNPAAAGHVLNLGLNAAAVLAVAAEPFMPTTSEKIFQMLSIQPLKWDEVAGFDFVQEGGSIVEIPHLFTRVTDDVVALQVEKLRKRKAEREAEQAAHSPAETPKVEEKPMEIVENEPKSVPAFKEMTSFPEFQKMDIRIGTILKAERVEKSKKLLKLLIDSGLDQRTILSGVAEHFAPEDLEGKQCTFLANLPPRPMMGTASEGMVLFAEDANGKLHLLAPQGVIDNGSTVN
jgi:methionyl-tRNA synthetase